MGYQAKLVDFFNEFERCLMQTWWLLIGHRYACIWWSTWWCWANIRDIDGHKSTLQWRHTERHGVSKYRRLEHLLNRLQIKEKTKLRVNGLYEGNPPVTGGFPSQKASDAENVSIWWRHHGDMFYSNLELVLQANHGIIEKYFMGHIFNSPWRSCFKMADAIPRFFAHFKGREYRNPGTSRSQFTRQTNYVMMSTHNVQMTLYTVLKSQVCCYVKYLLVINPHCQHESSLMR